MFCCAQPDVDVFPAVEASTHRHFQVEAKQVRYHACICMVSVHCPSHLSSFNRNLDSETNFLMGAVAAAGSVAVMIPMDTVKTRLVTQVQTLTYPYPYPNPNPNPNLYLLTLTQFSSIDLN